jgi:hypothetical protein
MEIPLFQWSQVSRHPKWILGVSKKTENPRKPEKKITEKTEP